MRKVIWVILIIAIIIIGIVCGIILNKTQKSIPSKETSANGITNIEENSQVNELQTNEVQNTEIENTQIGNEQIAQNTQTESTEGSQGEEPRTIQEKAIQIVKNDYNKQSNVEFNVEGTDTNGNPIVVVRNPQTTEALAFYFVDTQNGTFTKKEMN